jgi:hypothetical protein
VVSGSAPGNFRVSSGWFPSRLRVVSGLLQVVSGRLRVVSGAAPDNFRVSLRLGSE